MAPDTNAPSGADPIPGQREQDAGGGAPPPAVVPGLAPPRVRKANAPSDAQLKHERANASRRDNLALARERKAQKHAEEPEAKPEKPLSGELLQAGARLFIRALWMTSNLVARVAGGQLRPLTQEECDEGAREALPVLKRFAFLCTLLSILGLPLWLADTVGKAFERKPAAEKKPDAARLHSVPPGSVGGP